MIFLLLAGSTSPSFAKMPKDSNVSKGIVCNAATQYQYSDDVIYSPSDPTIDWVLTKTHTAYVHGMEYYGFTSENIKLDFKNLIQILITIDKFYKRERILFYYDGF